MSKKNVQLLLETKNTFSFDLLQQNYWKWDAHMNELESLHSDENYRSKLVELEKVVEEYDHSKQMFESALQEWQGELERYHYFIQQLDRLSNDVAECCYQEFQIRVELVLPTENQ